MKLAPEQHTSGRTYPTLEEVERAAEAVAAILHALLCRYNHTDGCPWEYEERLVACWATGQHAVWKARAHWVLEHGYELPSEAVEGEHDDPV